MRAYTYKSEEQRQAEELEQAKRQELLKKELAQELKADILQAETEIATVPDLSPERAAALTELKDTSESLFFEMEKGEGFHLNG